MADYTADVEARLSRDAGVLSRAWVRVQTSDIRAALGEIRRRGPHPDDLGIPRDAAGLSARCAELRDRLVAQGKRAEAAEAKLAQARADILAIEDRLSTAHGIADELQAEVERLEAALRTEEDR